MLAAVHTQLIFLLDAHTYIGRAGSRGQRTTVSQVGESDVLLSVICVMRTKFGCRMQDARDTAVV